MSGSYDAYRAAQAYRGVAVAVSPLKAVVMLLDGAITFLKKAIEAGEARRLEESHNHVVRTTAILRGLSLHLNAEKGGALADRLLKTYNTLILACLRSFGQPDSVPRYRRIISSLTELRDAWLAVLTSDVRQTPVR